MDKSGILITTLTILPVILFTYLISEKVDERTEFYNECVESGEHTKYECKALSREAYPI